MTYEKFRRSLAGLGMTTRGEEGEEQKLCAFARGIVLANPAIRFASSGQGRKSAKS